MVVDGIDYINKIVYEFNGDHVHGSHYLYKKDRDVKTWLGKTPNELYYSTIERYNFLTSIGYKVFFVWESQYKAKKTNGRFYKGSGDNLY